jgi:hypothetical protein
MKFGFAEQMPQQCDNGFMQRGIADGKIGKASADDSFDGNHARPSDRLVSAVDIATLGRRSDSQVALA